MEAGRSGYERLDVYQRAIALLPRVHAVFLMLPDVERYELASQMRRASRSVPTNIAEGYAKRRSSKEFCAYLTTAMGSANEMEVHLKIAAQIGYLDSDVHHQLVGDYSIVGKQLNRLIASWRGSPVTSDQQPATRNQG